MSDFKKEISKEIGGKIGEKIMEIEDLYLYADHEHWVYRFKDLRFKEFENGLSNKQSVQTRTDFKQRIIQHLQDCGDV